MYFKVNTYDPYCYQIWTSQTDRHLLKTASLMIFLNSLADKIFILIETTIIKLRTGKQLNKS